MAYHTEGFNAQQYTELICIFVSEATMQSSKLGLYDVIPIYGNYSKIISFPAPAGTHEGYCRLVTNEMKALNHSGGSIIVPHLPGYQYVILPNSEGDQGNITYSSVTPPIIFDFDFGMDIILSQVKTFNI